VSVIPFAMSEQKQNPQKTENPNTEENQTRSEKAIQTLTLGLLDSLINTVVELDNYRDFLSESVNNPFYITSVSDVIHFKIELEAPIKIPFYLGVFAFGENAEINSIAVKGDSIILWYSNGSTIERYTIDLSTEKLSVMDITILLYVLSNLSMNNASMFALNLKGFKDSIAQEKERIIKLLRNYGIEINN